MSNLPTTTGSRLGRALTPTRVVFLAAVAFTLYLQTSIPGLVFATGDAGLKFLMTRQFSEGQLTMDLRLPADPWVQELWQTGLYPVPYPNVIESGGRRLPQYPLAFPAASAVPYRWLGYRGLYLLPLAATWLVWLGLIRACRASGAGETASAATLAVLAFGTPLTFYSATFWEHAPATALAFGGLAIALAESRRVPRRAAGLLAGALVGTAPLLREELFVFAGSLGVLGVAFALHPRLAVLARSFLAGLLGASLLVLLSNLALYGHPMGMHAVVTLALSDRAATGSALATLRSLVWGAFTHCPLVALAIPASLAALARRRTPQTLLAALMLLLAVVSSLVVPAIIRTPGGRQWGPRFLLIVFPLVCLAIAPLFEIMSAERRRWLRRLGYATVGAAALLGVRTNTLDASTYLFKNYAERALSLRAVEVSASQHVAVSNESVALQLASLMGPKQFLLTRRATDVRDLARRAASAGQLRFLYVCYPRYGCGRLEEGPERLTFFRAGTSRPFIEFTLGGAAGRYLIYEARIVSASTAADVR